MTCLISHCLLYTSRAIPILKEVGITTKVINMRPYKDPDEFIKALGAQAVSYTHLDVYKRQL